MTQFISILFLSCCLIQIANAKDSMRPEQDAVMAVAKKAMYCKVKSDCKGPIGICPFGCDIYVNKKEYKRIVDMMVKTSTCEYTCRERDQFDCIDGKCQVLKK